MDNNSTKTYELFDTYPDVLTVEQLQSALGIGRTTAYKLIRTNEIRHLRIGKTIKIPKYALVNYILSLEQGDLCYNIGSNGQVNQAVRKEIS